MPLTGLALCVMNGAVTDGDRFVFNTCGCTIRSASRDKLGGAFFVRIISISFHLAGCLQRMWSRRGAPCATAHRLSSQGKQKINKMGRKVDGFAQVAFKKNRLLCFVVLKDTLGESVRKCRLAFPVLRSPPRLR